ncbi:MULTISPECIES: hypothetical protein [unclassified Rhizobium]|uniref:hypothetical protein n=1 Tax=unclassified Rhizobium TaxID=2613769 RepID=UPI001620EBC9|nr:MULTISPECIES: hypothetical protein [unclassified Rhizobium]MBB3385520.1 hypothetical protein [Rhizobium sp. BK098]MBB3617225.1 hypothetical protein [Rhizobium sp. BK609]MBB3682939.1 hypothetical protein [Rhizobium sp. BK612]
MPNTIPAAGEASLDAQTTNQRSAVEGALLDLEGQICDLYCMIHASTMLFERLIEKPLADGTIKYISSYERDIISFAWNNLASRASELRRDFYAAAHDEGVQ